MLVEITILILLCGTILYFLKIKGEKEAKKQKLLSELSEYLHKDYDNRMDGYIHLFKDRLLTLEDEENFHFHDVGVVEYDIFVKHLNELAGKIKLEINEATKTTHALATDIGILHEFFLTIDNYVASLVNKYSTDALVLLTTKLMEIHTKNSIE